MVRSPDSFVLDTKENNLLQFTIVGIYHRIIIVTLSRHPQFGKLGRILIYLFRSPFGVLVIVDHAFFITNLILSCNYLSLDYIVNSILTVERDIG
jgi:hypothetical protein